MSLIIRNILMSTSSTQLIDQNEDYLCKEGSTSSRSVNLEYRYFTIVKNNGSNRRFIQAPTDRLKKVQRAILEELVHRYKLSDKCTSIRGKSFVDNGRAHEGSR